MGTSADNSQTSGLTTQNRYVVGGVKDPDDVVAASVSCQRAIVSVTRAELAPLCSLE